MARRKAISMIKMPDGKLVENTPENMAKATQSVKPTKTKAKAESKLKEK